MAHGRCSPARTVEGNRGNDRRAQKREKFRWGGGHCRRPSLAGAGTEEGHDEEDVGGQTTGKWKGAREAGRLKGAGKQQWRDSTRGWARKSYIPANLWAGPVGGNSFRQNIGKTIYVYALQEKLHVQGAEVITIGIAQ